MDPNYRINMVTRFVMFAICVFYINLIYTIYVGIVIEDDWTIVLQATALLPSGLEGMTKLISILKDKDGWRFLGMALENVYIEYEQKNQRYRECLMKHILILKFQDLNAVLQDTHDSSETFLMLADIFKWHQQYIYIIEKTEMIFFNVVFVQIFAKAYGMLVSLVCHFLGVWPLALLFLVYSFVMLNSYCALGTVVETSNGEVRDCIYNECLWYEMSVTEQKMVLIMLMKSQNTINLSVGRVMDLSMATALSVTKAIYSYAMVLNNFLQ
ncbi:odorant receptor 67d-like [Scaptodrosophila lebanonensis]|uniref:Odorant receptor 67d-like n=1 Tax=Drosophila lebanonensis TaxID=7225 RepID=A0A6J2UIE7_DROLE|nr:odorant receptor 67d-like [Scaptodrosophila lebanonensis]